MPGAFETIDEGLAASERRTHSRQPVRTLAYVELDEGNGGIVLNASEGGLSVQAVMSLMEDALPKMRFQLSQSNEWLETSARVVWANESRKVAGLQFVDLPEETRLHIREWLSGGAAEAGPGEHRERAAAYNRAHEQADKQADRQPGTPPESQTHSQPANEEFQPSGTAKEPDATAATPAPALESVQAAAPPPAARVLGQVGAGSAKTRPTLSGSLATVDSDRAWNIVGLVAVLAIVSLIAGWIAGRGTFDGLWQKSPKAASPGGSSQPLPPASTGASAAISDIEIVDIHNQRWTVPFDPTANGYQASYRGQSQSAQWPAFNPAATTPEIQSPTNRGDATSQEPNPPEVANPDNAASVPLPTQTPARELVPPPAPAEPQTARPASALQRGALIYHVDPVYPELAREQEVQGTVRLLVTIGQTGAVESVVAVSGPGLLIEAARSAVRRWRYTPSLLDGKPVESQVYVSVVFQLPSASR